MWAQSKNTGTEHQASGYDADKPRTKKRPLSHYGEIKEKGNHQVHMVVQIKTIGFPQNKIMEKKLV